MKKHSAMLLTFIKLLVVIRSFVLSIFEWPLYTSFTVKHSVNLKIFINESKDKVKRFSLNLFTKRVTYLCFKSPSIIEKLSFK